MLWLPWQYILFSQNYSRQKHFSGIIIISRYLLFNALINKTLTASSFSLSVFVLVVVQGLTCLMPGRHQSSNQTQNPGTPFLPPYLSLSIKMPNINTTNPEHNTDSEIIKNNLISAQYCDAVTVIVPNISRVDIIISQCV